jgi:hypothetical protein
MGKASGDQGSADPAPPVRLCDAKAAEVDHVRIEKRRGKPNRLIVVKRQPVSEDPSVQPERQVQPMSSLAVAVVFDPPALGGHIEPLLEVVVRNDPNHVDSSSGWTCRSGHGTARPIPASVGSGTSAQQRTGQLRVRAGCQPRRRDCTGAKPPNQVLDQVRRNLGLARADDPVHVVAVDAGPHRKPVAAASDVNTWCRGIGRQSRLSCVLSGVRDAKIGQCHAAIM